MTKQELLLQTFKSKFDLSQYKKFIVEFFNDAKLLNGEKRNDYWNWNEYSFYINGYFHVADYLDEKRNKIAIFAVELKKGKSLEKARSKQRNFIADRIKVMGYDGAIAAFYSEDEKENRWRLSFVRLDYEILKGKIKTNFTPAKRYSYLLGRDEPCHTAMQQLYPILEEEKFNPSIDKLEEAFSVEKVTKQFFEKYKEKYIELYEYLTQNETFVDEAIRCIRSDKEEDVSKFTEQFAKKLMGQIVFMYFLQKKGWLGVNAFPPKISEREYKNSFFNCNNEHKEIMKKLYLLDSDGNYVRQGGEISALSEEQQTYFASRIKGMPWETGPKNFVRILFNEAIKNTRNYFEYYLEPLFYEALNEKRGADNYYARLHCRIPFLNGGLFEPLDGYDWKNNEFSIPNEIFSNASIKGDREADGILDIFDRYNFTMNEDEPLEKEVAVDPEMLGKIFENLLDVKDRKSKGAFYTPREIVHYMCQESLINYIVNTVGTPYEDTKDFILYGEIMKDEDCSREVKQGIADMLMPESIYKNLKLIDDALADVRVADPAVGSGAFPMGMVNEIVKARENITAYFARELTSNAQKHQLWNYTRHPYMLKKDAMKNSIFAVDIEPSAVDITKLRLWLSLVVEFDINSDNDEFKNPPTLPNLECNILCGNSLIDEFEGVKLFNDSLLTGASSNSNWMADLFQNQVDSTLTKLIDKQKELFYANNHDDKYRLKREIDVLQQQVIFASCTMTDDIKERFISTFTMPSKPYILWKLAFAKVFKDKGGFDIVIGNPPYFNVQTYGAGAPIVSQLMKNYSEIWMDKSDILFYFMYLGYKLSAKQVCYITSNAYLFSDKAKKFRNFIISKFPIKEITNFENYMVFDTASITSCITLFENKLTQGNEIRTKAKVLKNSALNLNQVLYNDRLFFDVVLSKDENFALIPARIKELDLKIKSNYPQLGKLMKVGKGMETAANNVFLFDQKPNFPDKFLRYRVTGDMISKYMISEPSQYLLYYEDIDEWDSLDESIKAHLNINKEFLENRATVKNEGRIWWKYSRPMHKEYYHHKKIWCSYRNNHNCFALDETSDFIGFTNTTAIFESNPNISIKYVLALVNSKLLEYQHKNNNKQTGGGIYEYFPNSVDKYPIPEISKSEQQKFIDVIDQILTMKKENINADISEQQTLIDLMVYNLYELTPEEIALVEESVK